MRFSVLGVFLLLPLVTLAAAPRPEAILAAAKNQADNQPWRVEASTSMDKDMRIAGIIHGKDFDLTTELSDGSVTRQITIGDKSWASADGGATWKPGDAKDRRFYYIVHTPINFRADEKIPPFERLVDAKHPNPATAQIRFINAQKIAYEGDRPNYWIAMDGEKPRAILRYHGPGVFERDYVTSDVKYTPVPAQGAVLPPPGNPQARAPEAGPERLLAVALQRMSEGVWKFSGTATYTKTIKLSGLLAGEDFDITMDPGVKPEIPTREVVIGNKVWICSDGKTWHTGDPKDRMIYNLAHTPILSGRLLPKFEKLGAEPKGNGTLLRLRLKTEEKVADSAVPVYTLVLNEKGEALYVGHVEIPMVSAGRTEVTVGKFDYAPASEQIRPPVK